MAPVSSAIDHTFFLENPTGRRPGIFSPTCSDVSNRGTSVPIYLIRLPKRCDIWRRSSSAPPAKRIACHRLPDGELVPPRPPAAMYLIKLRKWCCTRRLSSPGALCLHNFGHSQEDTARRIASEHRITVPRRTISDWISGYRSITTFHRLRAAAILQFGRSMLKERTLDHQQVYQYKVHLAKLALTVDVVPAVVAAKVKAYLLSVLENLPDVLFQDDSTASLDHQAAADDRSQEPPGGMRSSKSRFETLPLSRIEK